MAVRSVAIEIRNESSSPEHPDGFTLALSRVEKCWGKWSSGGAPPATIPNNGSALIRAESDGVASGTTGLFEYQFRPHTGLTPARPGEPNTPWPPYRLFCFFDNSFFCGILGAAHRFSC